MKKVLILGMNSYIGNSFQSYTEEKYRGNYEITRISLRGDDWRAENWSEYDSVVNVSAKVHVAKERFTETEIREYDEINCNLACETAKKALNEGVGQYIFLSTMSIYGLGDSKKPFVIRADTKPNPQNPYGKSKWKAEVELNKLFQSDENKSKTKLVIIRPPMVYGKGCKGNYQTLVKLAKICPVVPDYQNGRSMLFVDNLSEFIAQAIQYQLEGVFFPQDKEYVNTADMVVTLANASGRKVRKCKVLNLSVKLGKCMPGRVGRMVRKAFGTLVYDIELSKVNLFNYQKYEMKEAIIPGYKKKALMLAHVSSMIDLFNMRNIEMLQKMGYEVHVAANFKVGNVSSPQRIEEFKKELEQKNIKWFQIDFERNVLKIGANLKAYHQVKSLEKEWKYDLLHCHTPIGGVVGRIVGHKFGIYTIYTAHGFHFFNGAPKKNWLLFYPVEKFLSRYTDELLVINHEDYELAEKKFHMKKLCYIPGIGIDTTIKELTDIEKKEKRIEIGVPADAFMITCAAEFSANKNQKTVIKAIEKMNNPNIYYVMCGIGEKKSELETYVAEHNSQKNIIFAGFRKDIHEILRASDCFVLSSYREGLSVAMMEAMAAELPVVCGKIRGNVDLIEDNIGGYLVAPGEVQEYCNAFTKLFEMKQKEPWKFENMGEANRCKIQKFDKKTVDKIMREVYQRAGSTI